MEERGDDEADDNDDLCSSLDDEAEEEYDEYSEL